MSISIVKHFQSKFLGPKIGQKFAVLGYLQGLNIKDEC